MKKAFITISLFTILIGVFAVAMNIAFGSQTSTWIYKIRQESGIYMYKFDFANYITNINLAMTETTYLQLENPTGTWINNAGENILESQYWIDTWNNMKLALNWFLYVINILIYPMRIGGYITKNLLAIIGVNMDTTNTNNGLAWLVELANYLIRVQVNYIN